MKEIEELRKRIKALKVDDWYEKMALKSLDQVESYINMGFDK